MGRPNFWVIIGIVTVAAVIGLALAAAYFYIRQRPDLPPGTFEFTVDGQPVRVEADPNRLVTFPDESVGQGGQEVQPAPTNTSIPVATATPIPTAVPLPTATPVPPTKTLQVIFEPYQVGPGDTLYGITRKRNTTIPLMARYGISAAKLIPGMTIQLPVANPAFCASGRPYVVQEGDTLSRIGRRFNTTVNTLIELNNFQSGYRLDLTQVICVPA